jgi:hypothetical protein
MILIGGIRLEFFVLVINKEDRYFLNDFWEVFRSLILIDYLVVVVKIIGHLKYLSLHTILLVQHYVGKTTENQSREH